MTDTNVELETLTREQLLELVLGLIEDNRDTLERLARLDVLEAAGVDSWEGYEHAMESLRDAS